ncbi:hypothetical protein CEP54_014138 [Fusarium duplospermum]|uniref:AttH domain-containing protein n=1 Tax=Fusarium duplospermum TaxID=1325734 RepID=A0A428NY75_9HYPO|nr:hypothetical protein CEP54_014138 [Fusarium duplospermum]
MASSAKYGPVLDVRESQLIRDFDPNYVNSHWVAHWITTKSNLDLLVVSHASLRAKANDPEGSNLYGGSVYELDSGFFSDYFAIGETVDFNPKILDMKFTNQYRWYANTPDSFSSITSIGKWDNHGWNITFEPRGPNLYDGGSAAFFWGTDYNLTINGTQHEVDPKPSTSWYDRQWGVGIAKSGWYWFPIQLRDGTRICAWVVNPVGDYHKSFATVLRTDGTHEVVTKKGRLETAVPFGKERQHGEFGAADKYVALYEAYATVEGTWEGKRVSGWGISEQKPFYG